MTKVFVYGTLKQGYGNHRLLTGAKFLGEFTTKQPFNLRDGGFPYAVRNQEENNGLVKGEVYEVDDDILQQLDWLEGVPRHYQRQPVEIDGLEGVQMYSVEGDYSRLPLCKLEDGVYTWFR